MAARRGQGQWALGYREPLNPNERSKRDSNPLTVRQRIIDIYQHTGFAGTACTRSAVPASPAGGPPSWNPKSSRTSTSCCGSASTAAP